MPKRVSPKRNWKPQASLYNPPRPFVIYSEASVAAICKAHGIPTKFLKQLHSNLEYWGHVYNSFEVDAETKPTNAQVGASIIELKAQAAKLYQLLTHLDDMADRLVGKAWHDLMQEAMCNKEAPMREIGAWVDYETEGGTGSHLYDWGDIHATIRFLGLICDKALSGLPKGTKGRKKHFGLDLWTYQVAGFWLEDLDRPLTADAIKGHGISPAAVFLADCMRPLDPKAVHSLPTSLKRVRPNLIRAKAAPYKIQLLMQTKPA